MIQQLKRFHLWFSLLPENLIKNPHGNELINKHHGYSSFFRGAIKLLLLAVNLFTGFYFTWWLRAIPFSHYLFDIVLDVLTKDMYGVEKHKAQYAKIEIPGSGALGALGSFTLPLDPLPQGAALTNASRMSRMDDMRAFWRASVDMLTSPLTQTSYYVPFDALYRVIYGVLLLPFMLIKAAYHLVEMIVQPIYLITTLLLVCVPRIVLNSPAYAKEGLQAGYSWAKAKYNAPRGHDLGGDGNGPRPANDAGQRAIAAAQQRADADRQARAEAARQLQEQHVVHGDPLANNQDRDNLAGFINGFGPGI